MTDKLPEPRKGPRKPPRRKRSSAKYIDDPTEPDRCHAARKSDGKRCGNSSEPGQAVCRFHGGAGSGAPIKTGAYSLSLYKYRERYEDALGDEQQLYSLNETLALMHVAVERAVVRTEEADTPDMRKRALELLLEARTASDETTAAQKLAELQKLLISGVNEDRALTHMVSAVEKLAGMKVDAWGVKLKAAHSMNVRESRVIMGMMVNIVLKVCGAEKALEVSDLFSAELEGGAAWD